MAQESFFSKIIKVGQSRRITIPHDVVEVHNLEVGKRIRVTIDTLENSENNTEKKEVSGASE